MTEPLRKLALRLTPARDSLPADAGIALTFDDGPHPVFTPKVLDVLARHDARATFFLVGKRAERYPDLVLRIAAEGHALGSHSWSHREPGSLSSRELARDYRAGRRAVEAAAEGPARLFRPPRGLWDARTSVLVRALRMEPWLWTLDSEDWRPGISSDEIAARLDGLGGGEVVLLHDALELATASEAEDRSATVAALPHVIARIRELGLECVALPT